MQEITAIEIDASFRHGVEIIEVGGAVVWHRICFGWMLATPVIEVLCFDKEDTLRLSV